RRVALIMIDLDRFKRVNDGFGHLMGDQVLQAVARLLSRHALESDLVGRFGGEEFTILIRCPGAAAHAVDLATRLRSEIAALELPLNLRVTASFGIAHLVPAPDSSLDEILASADTALYEAKARGRDCVHVLAKSA
ncbi:MAG: GGDEF domain-containing protein, partial [Jatrophihabitantaceae bacterium]